MRALAFAAVLLLSAAPACAQENPSGSLPPLIETSAPGPLVTSIEIDAPVAEAWAMWTTEEGLAFFAPAALVELEPGGAYEVWFLPDAPEGQRGSEGTHILGFQTERMLTFTWALPPYMPEVRPHLTPVTITFDDLGGERTRVTLAHSGWGQGGQWDQARAYFETTWPAVLDLMKQAAEAE